MRRRAQYEKRARVIKALAHPSRLMMVDALVDGDLCVCELQKIVGSDMSTVSKHLSVLKAAGIVSDRKVGQQVHYSLRVHCILNFFECIEAVVKSAAGEQLELVR